MPGAGALGLAAGWHIVRLLHGDGAFVPYVLGGAVLLAGALVAGLAFQKRAGLEARPAKAMVPFGLVVAVVLGLAAGFSILAFDAFLSLLAQSASGIPGVPAYPVPGMPAEPEPGARTLILTPWQGLLASLYAGVVEEIILRLFLMSLAVWALVKLTKKARPTSSAIWTGLALVALVSGLVHVPLMASFAAMSSFLVLRFWLLGIAPAFLYGWLYWKKGIAAAMIAHFTADFFIFVLVPLIA